MVLESLINPFRAEKEPADMIPLGILFSSVAIILSLWIFEKHTSLVMVFLTVLACVPLIFQTITLEEKKDLTIKNEHLLLKEHARAILFFVMLFVGMTASFTMWYVFLPEQMTETVFSIQTQTILSINNEVTGNVLGNPERQLSFFTKIFFNNIKVLVFCILFAFIYGFGSIFILTWNASVIGAAMGNFIRINLAQTSTYFHVASLGVLRYALHGIPEIAAYFTAGLAGGIISVAVISHDYGSERFNKILIDSSDLIIISICLLLIAGIIEVFITPLLF